MNRWAGLVVAAMTACAAGCAVGTTPYDYAYAAYGGIRQRHDMYRGRVGSIADPALAEGMPVLEPAGQPLPVLGPPAESAAQPPAEPETPAVPDLGPGPAPGPAAAPLPEEAEGQALPELPEDMEFPPFEPDGALGDPDGGLFPLPDFD